MTNDEAVAYIIRHCNPDYPKGKTEWETAINMAIDALRNSQIQMSGTSDAVSRRMVLDALHEYMNNMDYTVGYLHDVICNLPSAQLELTDEQAIKHLQSSGWMQNHDREMYEMGLKKQLADDSGSYDALIPTEDTISRQAAIDAIEFGITYAKAINKETGEVKELFRASNDELRKAADRIKQLPSAQPEIVRCKDCKWKQGAECVRFAEVRPFPDDFCSRAERRTDERTDSGCEPKEQAE